MSNDFRGSIAQEDVDFVTELQISTNPGDNYMRTGIFIDRNPDYITADGDDAFLPIIKDGSGNVINDMAIITKNNYSEVCAGRLLTWMTDLFCNQHPYQVMLFRFGPDGGISTESSFDDLVRAELTVLVNKVKPVCYHKSILVQDLSTDNLMVAAALYFTMLLAQDKLLNSKPYFPHTPTEVGIASTDPLWNALKAGGLPAMMTYHADLERNGALFQLGMALKGLNASGTPVGDAFDYEATNLITPSGQPDPSDPDFEYSDWEDYNLTVSQKAALTAAHISFFKTIGNGTGMVAAVGDVDTAGGVMQADWIVNYCNFVNKVKIAERITRRNSLKSAVTYSDIMTIVMGTVNRFGDMGSGRLKQVVNTSPSFQQLPAAGGREIVIPNAWSAYYVFGIHRVQVQGTLMIEL
jgi:hypothetical protein